MCQKAQGSAFRTRASVKVSDFNFISGQNLLKFYESSPGEWRSFCGVCGATIITRFESIPDTYGFALGTLDTDPGVAIQRHIFTKYKAPWFEITDDLPQIEELSETDLQEAKSK